MTCQECRHVCKAGQQTRCIVIICHGLARTRNAQWFARHKNACQRIAGHQANKQPCNSFLWHSKSYDRTSSRTPYEAMHQAAQGPSPKCETVCGEAVCHLECGESSGPGAQTALRLAVRCETSCDDPVCSFDCSLAHKTHNSISLPSPNCPAVARVSGKIDAKNCVKPECKLSCLQLRHIKD